SRRRHTRLVSDWSSDVCSSDLSDSARAADTIGRLHAEALTTAFGKQFYVENRVGGGGLVGTEAVARAESDGLTLMVSGIPTHVRTGERRRGEEVWISGVAC